ncbi:MAG: AraC family transcriptional regulator, transcriptional activator FtrA, partial [Frankiaceae bacterium]|nr:AraC family transcriptional regulator, transcriptional activator FtrA [Frankiaceae bacterium]
MPKRRRHVVAALAVDGVAPFELAVACEVFGIDRSELADPWYEF